MCDRSSGGPSVPQRLRRQVSRDAAAYDCLSLTYHLDFAHVAENTLPTRLGQPKSHRCLIHSSIWKALRLRLSVHQRVVLELIFVHPEKNLMLGVVVACCRALARLDDRVGRAHFRHRVGHRRTVPGRNRGEHG